MITDTLATLAAIELFLAGEAWAATLADWVDELVGRDAVEAAQARVDRAALNVERSREFVMVSSYQRNTGR